jgi:FKBP-type peptidyl-prolyl cis-trans isomerase FkpA
MKEGDSWELVVPSDLGYGQDGAGDDIPPNQTLVFDMTLLKVTPAR